MKRIFAALRGVWRAGAFSPSAFVARAFIIAVCYCLSEIAGLREYTTFLSGTSANLNVSWQTAATLGLIHLLLYVSFILLAPASLIAAGLLVAYRKWAEGRGGGEQQQSGLAAEIFLSSADPAPAGVFPAGGAHVDAQRTPAGKQPDQPVSGRAEVTIF